MFRKTVILILLIFGVSLQAQDCPLLSNPRNGSVGVPVNTTITWPAVDGIIGYLISLGTTPGGGEILNRRSAGLNNSYTPEVGLPENTTIYVTISLFLDSEPLKICAGESFTTEDVTTPPVCTSLNDPIDNASGVNVNTDISWNYAPRATNYRLSIGTSPGGVDLLDNFITGNVLTYNPGEELPMDQEIFVQITPFNENGDASNCREENFSTGMEIINCVEVLDPLTGEMTNMKPEIDFPDEIGLCLGSLPNILTSDDNADGFIWYRINEDNSETLLSVNNTVEISEVGDYRLVSYNLFGQEDNPTQCESSKVFRVIISERAEIISVDIERIGNSLRIEAMVAGAGDYEYALDDETGPYQESSVFLSVPYGYHTLYVRDKNGCGVSSRVLARNIVKDDFPRFFTPNGDGINDYWQYIPPKNKGEIELEMIHIFDQYGNLITQIDPDSAGWDGSLNGLPLPSSDYWFKATDYLNFEYSGHFTLKR